MRSSLLMRPGKVIASDIHQLHMTIRICSPFSYVHLHDIELAGPQFNRVTVFLWVSILGHLIQYCLQQQEQFMPIIVPGTFYIQSICSTHSWAPPTRCQPTTKLHKTLHQIASCSSSSFLQSSQIEQKTHSKTNNNILSYWFESNSLSKAILTSLYKWTHKFYFKQQLLYILLKTLSKLSYLILPDENWHTFFPIIFMIRIRGKQYLTYHLCDWVHQLIKIAHMKNKWLNQLSSKKSKASIYESVKSEAIPLLQD